MKTDFLLIIHYNLKEPLLYMRFVIDQNIILLHIIAWKSKMYDNSSIKERRVEIAVYYCKAVIHEVV